MTHWHGYTYNGRTRPPDAEARNPQFPVPPIAISEWPGKPRSMLVGTWTEPADAIDWLEAELTAAPPYSTDLPVEVLLEYAAERIVQTPGDVVTRYYSPAGYVVRDVIRCTGRCPRPPR